MADKKQRKPALQTPQGVAIYPHLNTPDTKFNDKGVYTVKLSIPTVACEKLIEDIDKLFAEAQEEMLEEQRREAEQKGKKPPTKLKSAEVPYKIDPDNEDNTVLSFKMNSSYKDKKTGKDVFIRPPLFDAKLNTLPPDTKVGGGSVLRVSFRGMPFYTALIGAGLSLRLEAVQVIKLVEWGGGNRDAGSYGFGEEEGFEHEESAEAPEFGGGEEKNNNNQAAGGDAGDF